MLHVTTGIIIPAKMADLPRDERGLPVPAIVLRDDHGRPHFSMNDTTKVHACLAEDRCSICFGKLGRLRCWVGGPRSALEDEGWYLDPPVHIECAEYALRVCPYLAAPRYARQVGGKTLAPGAAAHVVASLDLTTDPNRPEVFCLAAGTRTNLRRREVATYSRPSRPLRRLSFWIGGIEVGLDRSRPAIARAMAIAEADVEIVVARALGARDAVRVANHDTRRDHDVRQCE